MSFAGFATPPKGIPKSPTPFTFGIPQDEEARLLELVKTAEVGAPSYYNTHADAATGTFGLSRDWLVKAREHWLNDFDWAAQQEKLNRYPNFHMHVTTSDGQLFYLHFAALFSQNPDANNRAVVFMHGWPGAWFEFGPMLDLLRQKYTPETLPFHVIVPSIPDYGFSKRPRGEDGLGKELTLDVATEAMNELMKALGFNKYIAQGGDIGAILAQVMAARFEECVGFHLNLYFMRPEQVAAVANIPTTPEEQAQLGRAANWVRSGMSYSTEHATRPSTIGLVLMSNPVAILAWVGEKFIEWSDNRKEIPLDSILSFVSWYWHTHSFGRSMWAYHSISQTMTSTPLPLSLTKPFGFSSFPAEIASALPRSWAEKLFPNLVSYRAHDKGGHFAALEEPDLFLNDVEEFLSKVTF